MEKPTTIPQRDNAPSGVRIEESETEVAVIITDLQLHATTPRKPKSFAEGVRKTINTGRPGRTHQVIGQTARNQEPGTFQFSIPIAGMDEVIAQAAARGKRVRFFLPKGGVPVFLGKDAVERMEALKRKGVL